MENGNRNKDIQEKKTFANYKNIDITDIMYLLCTYRAFAVMKFLMKNKSPKIKSRKLCQTDLP